MSAFPAPMTAKQAHAEGKLRGEHERITLALVQLKHDAMASGLYLTAQQLDPATIAVGFERANYPYPSQPKASRGKGVDEFRSWMRTRTP